MDLSTYSHERPFRWLYVSIINWYKHQATVVEAVARLRRDGLPLQVDFVGPAYSPALKSLAKTIRHLDPVGSFLKYHPTASGVVLERWYHQAHGFIFASSCENMPIILLEAMAAALPIACSRVPPMPEILRDAGGYFDPQNPVELANLLLRFMKDPQWRATCAHRAFAWSQEYTWEKCARATFDFVAQVSARQPESTVYYATSPASAQ
jgi:glycosyltransferase involved in cell wall biosynthesis